MTASKVDNLSHLLSRHSFPTEVAFAEYFAYIFSPRQLVSSAIASTNHMIRYVRRNKGG